MIAGPLSPAGIELAALLSNSPDAYPQNVDLVRDATLVLRLDSRAYFSASFLDDRLSSPSISGCWLPGPVVAAAAHRPAAPPVPLRFIFHTGHVGSTLLSRLLDETGVVLPLREPLPLRTLADAHDALARPEALLGQAEFGGLLETMLRLWARGYRDTRQVVVKATSSAGRLAPVLLAARADARAIYLNVRAETYLATLLGGTNALVDLRGHAPCRMRRLCRRLGAELAPLHGLSPGELAGLGWLAETLSQRDALRCDPRRVMALDFDAFLADVRAGLALALGHFGLLDGADPLDRIAASAVLQRYSKAPDVPFPPGERSARLASARRAHRDEIARGLDWLERMARAHEAAAAALGDGAA